MDNLSGAIPRFIKLALHARNAIETAIRMDTPPASGKLGSEERRKATEYLEARVKWNDGDVEDMPFAPEGETLRLLGRLQPALAPSELHAAYIQAYNVTDAPGLGADIRLKFEAIWKTHCDLLDAARRKAEAQRPENVDMQPIFYAHDQVLLPLLHFNPHLGGAGQAESAAETPAGHGVTLQLAANQFRPGEPEDQKELVMKWRNSKKPKLPKPIGKSLKHSQRNLFEPTSLITFIESFLGEPVAQEFGLAKAFKEYSEKPRPEVD